MGNLLKDPGYLAAIATFLTALLVGVIFNDKAKAREGAIGLMVLAAFIAAVSYAAQAQQAHSAVQEVPKKQQQRIDDKKDDAVSKDVPPKPPEKQVDGITIHNEPPVQGKLVDVKPPDPPKQPPNNGMIAGDAKTTPPPTFNPQSPIPAPRLPYELPRNPNRQMPVTMRPVPTPKDFVPKGPAQTVTPSQMRWVQLPDGSWQLQQYAPANNAW